LRLLKSTHITTGAPTSAVTELTGSAPSNPGILAIRLHNKANDAPHNNDAGKIVIWFDVWNNPRHICGTAKPKKIIGPQYAVTMATKMPEHPMTINLARLILSPKFLA
jgi:hypothetical protein